MHHEIERALDVSEFYGKKFIETKSNAFAERWKNDNGNNFVMKMTCLFMCVEKRRTKFKSKFRKLFYATFAILFCSSKISEFKRGTFLLSYPYAFSR